MDVEELNRRLQGVIDDLQGGAHGEVMIAAANDSIALITKRIQERGTNADGQAFEKYSTKPMWTNKAALTQTAYNKIAGSKGQRKNLRWIMVKRDGKNVRLFELEQGYKQYRELHGRQTRHTDFTFTGRMWSSVALVLDRSKLIQGEAIIRPQSQQEYQKMQQNVERKGQILDLSGDEIRMVQKGYDKGILQIFRNNGL